jgi:ABC-type bacteriocin/lantibiotic exporter with double-glycine peptidase domain
LYVDRTPDTSVFKQEHEYSCGAACGRQLLHHYKVAVSEAQVRDLAGFNPEDGGIRGVLLGPALEALQPGARYRVGGIAHGKLEELAGYGPFIARLYRHWVVVTEVSAVRVVVFDPAGIDNQATSGFVGILERKVFEERLASGASEVIFRIG